MSQQQIPVVIIMTLVIDADFPARKENGSAIKTREAKITVPMNTVLKS